MRRNTQHRGWKKKKEPTEKYDYRTAWWPARMDGFFRAKEKGSPRLKQTSLIPESASGGRWKGFLASRKEGSALISKSACSTTLLRGWDQQEGERPCQTWRGRASKKERSPKGYTDRNVSHPASRKTKQASSLLFFKVLWGGGVTWRPDELPRVYFRGKGRGRERISTKEGKRMGRKTGSRARGDKRSFRHLLRKKGQRKPSQQKIGGRTDDCKEGCENHNGTPVDNLNGGGGE